MLAYRRFEGGGSTPLRPAFFGGGSTPSHLSPMLAYRRFEGGGSTPLRPAFFAISQFRRGEVRNLPLLRVLFSMPRDLI